MEPDASVMTALQAALEAAASLIGPCEITETLGPPSHASPHAVGRSRSSRSMTTATSTTAKSTRTGTGHQHSAPRPSNWLLGPAADVYLVDFEHARTDVPLHDLVRLRFRVWPDRPGLKARS
jgi:hypothetical protein